MRFDESFNRNSNLEDRMKGHAAAGLGAMLLSLALAAAGCVDATPVGVIECGARFVPCGLPNVRDTTLTSYDRPTKAYSSADVQTVSAAWIREIPWDGADDIDPPGLVVDSNGELGVFRPQLDRLEILHFDRDGEVIKTLELEGPGKMRGARPGWAQPVVTPVDHGPVFWIDWHKDCREESQGPCVVSSELITIEDVERPSRFVPKWNLHGQVVASESDIWLIHDSQYGGEASVERHDYDGELRWRQEGLLERSGEWRLHGAVLGHNQLRVLVGNQSAEAAELWTMNERGDIESLVYLGFAWTGWPRPVVDARGRLNVIGTVQSFNSRDLYLLRLGDKGEIAGGIVLQEEFKPLYAEAIATDRAGAVYVATAAGGRTLGSERPTVCRLDDEASIECFALASEGFGRSASIYEMALSEPGLLYVRVDGNIMRFDLPN